MDWILLNIYQVSSDGEGVKRISRRIVWRYLTLFWVAMVWDEQFLQARNLCLFERILLIKYVVVPRNLYWALSFRPNVLLIYLTVHQSWRIKILFHRERSLISLWRFWHMLISHRVLARIQLEKATVSGCLPRRRELDSIRTGIHLHAGERVTQSRRLPRRQEGACSVGRLESSPLPVHFQIRRFVIPDHLWLVCRHQHRIEPPFNGSCRIYVVQM